MTTMPPIVLVVDANNLAHRAAHSHRDLWWGDKFTGLFHGFFKMLDAYVKTLNPRHIVLVSDPLDPGAGRTFRHSWMPEYKNRAVKRSAEDERAYQAIKSQLPELRAAAQKLPVWWLEQPHTEADDMIAALVSTGVPGHNCVMVSTDKDLVQLVSASTQLFYPGSKKAFWVMHNPDHFKAAAGRFIKADTWLPSNAEEWLEYRLLVGDSSDNIPGVPGIGAKKAEEICKAGGWISWLEQINARGPKGKLEDRCLRDPAMHRAWELSWAMMKLPCGPINDLIMAAGGPWASAANNPVPDVQGFRVWCEGYHLRELQNLMLLLRQSR